jgi:hypothetical protein
MSIGAYLNRFDIVFDPLYENDNSKWVRRVKKSILKAVEKQTGITSGWVEGIEPDGQVGKELGGWENLMQLQRYAAHIHYTGIPPEKPAEGDELLNDDYLNRFFEIADNVESVWEQKKLKFPHLIITCDIAYFIPLDYPEPIQLEEEGKEGCVSVGSSVQLLSELEELNKYLFAGGDYGVLGDEGIYKLLSENENDQWRFAKWTWAVLHWLAKQSVMRNLCIYFE